MIERRRSLAGSLVAIATLMALCGCGTSAHAAATRSPAPSPNTVTAGDLLLTQADLPAGFAAFTPHSKPRPFCGHVAPIQPSTKPSANFERTSGNGIDEVRDVIATYASAARAQAALAEARSFLTTTCHVDVTSHGRDAITLIPAPGKTSLGVRQEVTGGPSIDGLTIYSLVSCSYYVLSGSSIIEMGIADVVVGRPGSRVVIVPSLPDLGLLKRLTLLQVQRFNSKTPAPGVAA